MPTANIAYTNTNVGPVSLSDFEDTVVVQLRIPDGGVFVIFGRVVIVNGDTGGQQDARARLTTFHGANELDTVTVRIDEGGDADRQSISLQGTLFLPGPNSNDIVDIRCSTLSGQAHQATLFAITIDGLSSSL
jgi:hypothetical protein